MTETHAADRILLFTRPSSRSLRDSTYAVQVICILLRTGHYWGSRCAQIGLHVKWSLSLRHFNTKCNVSTACYYSPPSPSFSVHENLLSCSRVATCIQTAIRMDVAKLVGAFCNLWCRTNKHRKYFQYDRPTVLPVSTDMYLLCMHVFGLSTLLLHTNPIASLSL